MKIVVCIKQVPARDSQLRVAPSGAWIQDADLSYEINEPDAYALEEALRLKEKHGGEVVVLCAGPGARRTDHPGSPGQRRRPRHPHRSATISAHSIRWALARLLAAAVAAEKPDLILTGLQSDDLGFGQTGVILAEMLGLPHATIIMEVETLDGAIQVKRELEDGWFQYVEMPLPALLTIQSGISKLRYATLMGIKKAKSKEIRAVSAASLGAASAASIRSSRVYLPERSKQTQLFDGPPKEAAAKLVEKLKFEARVI